MIAPFQENTGSPLLQATALFLDFSPRMTYDAKRSEFLKQHSETAPHAGAQRGREKPLEAKLTGIRREETLQYLGYAGSVIPPELEADLARCEGEILRTARPRAVWRLFTVLPDGSFAGTGFRPAGGDVPALLRDCDRAILMAATLGMECEALLRRAQARDMGEAVILDAAASAAVENVCDNLCADLAERFRPGFLTDRFSPGYGDFPLGCQRELCDILDVTRQIGVSLTESGLLLPQKTVTAVLGIAAEPQPHRHRGCGDCVLAGSCALRKEGKHCGRT